MNLLDLFAKLSLDTSDYEEGLKGAAGKAGGIGTALKTAAGVGAAAIGAASTAVTAFAGDSVKTAMAFDSSMSQVAATMGFTMDQLNTEGSDAALTFEKLSEFAQKMGAETAFSASQAADALNYMALAGYDADTSIAMLPNVLNLAAAGGIDLAAASDMVTDASSALGLSIDQTSQLVDKMAKASSKSNTSVAQLGQAMLTIGGTAKNLSGGTTELSTALGILADNGIKGAEGGTALRNILLNLTPKSEDAAKAMEMIGLNAYDAFGNMRPLSMIFADLNKGLEGMTTEQKTTVLANIFNKVDLKSVNALLATDISRWDELSTAIDGAWYSTESLEKGFSKVNLSLSGSQKTLESFGISAEDFNNMLSASSGSAKTFVSYLWEMSDSGTEYEDILNALGGDLDRIQQAFDSSTGAAQAMADVQLDNLSGDITLFQSALEGAKIAVSEGLTPRLREMVQFGSEAVSTLSMAFKNGGLEGAIDALAEILGEGAAMIIRELPTMVDAGMKLLSAVGEGIIMNLPFLVDAALQIVLSIASFLVENLPEMIPAIISVIMLIVETLTKPDTLVPLIKASLQIILAIAKGIINAIPELIDVAMRIIETFAEYIGDQFGKLVDIGRDILTEVGKGIRETIDKAKQWGGDLIKNFIDGIKQKWNDLKQSVAETAAKIKGYLGFSEPEEGPLSDFHTYAPDMMKLFAQGIRDNRKLVTDELEDSFDFAPVIKDQQAPQFDMMSGGMGLGGMMQDIVINLTAEIDGMVLARKMYRYNQDEALRLGTGLVEA